MLKTIYIHITRRDCGNPWKWYAVFWITGEWVEVAESYFMTLCKFKAWVAIRLVGPQYRVKFAKKKH